MIYEMKVAVWYSVNVIAESEDRAKREADRYFDSLGLYSDDTYPDSECVDFFDSIDDAEGEILVATDYGYDYLDDVKEEKDG